MPDRTDGEIQSQIQYRLTEEMVAAKARYRAFAERMRDPVFECDATGTLTYVNHAWEKVLGYASSRSVGRPIREFLGANASAFTFEERYAEISVNRPGGLECWLELSFWPNTPDGFVGFLRDITDRKEIERLRQNERQWLEREHENLRAFLEGVPVGMLLVDEHQQVLHHNVAAARLAGRTSVATGSRVGDFFRCARSFEIPRCERDAACRDCPVRNAVEQVLAGDAAFLEIETPMSLLIDGNAQVFHWRLNVSRLDLNGNKHALLCIIDLSGRKQMEEALRRSEERFRGFFDSTRDAIFVEDLNGNVLDVNPAACRLHGMDRQILIGKNVLQLVPPERRQEVKRAFSKLVKGEWNRVEGYSRTATGRAIPVELEVSRFDYEGTPSLLLHVRDTTRRKEAEEALGASERRYRLLAENAKDVIWTADLNLRWKYVSPSVESLLGYTPEEVMALGAEEILSPASLQLALKALAEELAFAEENLQAPPRTRLLELEQVCKDATTVWTEVVTNFILGEDGRPTGVIGVARDITKRRQSEARLRESEDNFRGFFESMNDSIVVADLTGKIVWANPATTSKLGYSADDLQEMQLLDIHRPEDRESAERIHAEMLRGDRTNCPLPLVAKDGRSVPAETRAWLGKWSGNEVLFGVTKDLTEQQAALEMFEKVFAANPTPMALTELANRNFVAVNRAFCEVTGFSGSEVIGKSSADLDLFVKPEEHGEIADQLDQQAAIRDVALTVRTKSGDFREGLFYGQIVESQEERFFLTAMIDVTRQNQVTRELLETQAALEQRVAARTAELRSTNDDLVAEIAIRRKTERSLEEHRGRLRELAARLALAEEQQRRKVAMHLHDTIGQELAMARLRLQHLASRIPHDSRKHLTPVTVLVDAACEHVHEFTNELGATVLYELGFAAAVRSLGKTVSEKHGIELVYGEQGGPQGLDKQLEVQLFRIVREFVYNVLRHARASRIDILLATRAGEVAVSVTDDGCGFRPKTKTDGRSHGFGLFSIREQLATLGGHLQIVSSPGHGTKAIAAVPLPDAAGEQEGDRKRHEGSAG